MTRLPSLRATALVALTLGLAGLAGATGAQAQAQVDTPAPEMQAAAREIGARCRNDIRAHCSGLEPGGGRIARCLMANEDKLSGVCRAAFTSVRSKGTP